MRPIPLISAVAILVLLALRHRTLSRTTAPPACRRGGRARGLRLRGRHAAEPQRGAHAPGAGARQLDVRRRPVLAYLESAAFVGLFVPGEMTVVLGGAIARDGAISIGWLFLLVWFAAVAGDSTGYLLGPQARARLPLPARAALPHHAGHDRPRRDASSTRTAARRS